MCPACDFTTFLSTMTWHGQGFRELMVPSPVLSKWYEFEKTMITKIADL